MVWYGKKRKNQKVADEKLQTTKDLQSLLRGLK